MQKLISFKLASKLLLFIYVFFMVYHLVLIIGAGFFGFIPLDIVWGGTIKNQASLIELELLSLIIMGVCLFLTLVKSKYIRIKQLKLVAHYFMWLAVAYFLFNTWGNLFAKTILEKSFSILTLLISLFSLRLALDREYKQNIIN